MLNETLYKCHFSRAHFFLTYAQMAIDQVQNLIPLRTISYYLRFLNSIKLPRVQTYSNLILQACGHLPPFKIRSNNYLQSKEERRWGFDREGNIEKLGQGTVDSPRTRIRRKDPHNKSEQSHLSALPQDKKETIYCFKGEVDIILNDRVVTLKEGEDITLLQKTVHRITGKKNSILFEVSTPQLADVVRL